MRIDFLGLEAFLSIAERGSFQRAAAHLNLSQTAISHRMRKLEEDLGLKLFARTTREVTLTRAGIDFLPKARRALAELEQSFDDLKQQGAKRRERLDIACLPVFAVNYLPPILRAFHASHPHGIFTLRPITALYIPSLLVPFTPSTVYALSELGSL